MNKAYKFRIYPNEVQRGLFARTFGCVRFIYNKMLEDKIRHYKQTGKSLSNTPAQYKGEFSWLKEVDSPALANARMNLQAAFTKFFSDPKAGFPKFKSKRRSRKSYTTNLVGGNITLGDGFLKLPKAGRIRVKQHREIPDGYRLKSVTVSQSPDGRYYASILFEYDSQVQEKKLNSFIGLDYSMSGLYKDSDGNEAACPRCYRMSQDKLAKEQRKLARMSKGSANYRRQRVKVARVHSKIAAQRKDFLHKLSKKPADGCDCVCVEDLDMKAMSQCLKFGKPVCDNSYGAFLRMPEYKLNERGGRLVKVGKFFAGSQICHVCGHRNPATKDLSVREWVCPVCGAKHDRDTNAAINIRNEGMRLVA